MRIDSVINRDGILEVTIDGRAAEPGEKYTILELGYAVYRMKDADEEWVLKNGDTIPADNLDHRGELRSMSNMLVTADPVLVAIALEDWWSHNGRPYAQNGPLPIPTAFEAVEIVKNRQIFNDFNKKYAGQVPGLQIMMKGGRLSRNR
jgi:hypothetical protein